MTDADLKAVYAYLTAIPPAEPCNRVQNGSPGFSGDATNTLNSYAYTSTIRVGGCCAAQPKTRLAANLRRLRHANGISQEDLAYEAGVNRTYVSKLEKGISYPGLEIIAKLATVLEVERESWSGCRHDSRHPASNGSP
jgi:DNA-binding XRE family transcriptional regulator